METVVNGSSPHMTARLACIGYVSLLLMQPRLMIVVGVGLSEIK